MEIGDFKVVGCLRFGKLFNLDCFDYNTASILGQERAGIFATFKRKQAAALRDCLLNIFINIKLAELNY